MTGQCVTAKPSSRREPGQQPGLVLAFDLGGTRLRAALVAHHHAEPEALGTMVSGLLCEPLGRGRDPLEVLESMGLELLRAEVEGKPARAGTIGAGIAMPGPADYSRGVGHFHHKDNLRRLVGLELGPRLEATWNLPVLFLSDARAWALGAVGCSLVYGALRRAELAYANDPSGAGPAGVPSSTRPERGSGRVLVLPLGTGLGSAFVLDGVVVEESALLPASGELWALPVSDQAGRVRRLEDHAFEPIRQPVRDYLEFAHRLGLGVGRAVRGFGPELVIVAGGVVQGAREELGADFGPGFVLPLTRTLEEGLGAPCPVEMLTGDEVPLLGTACHVWQKLPRARP